MYEDRLYQTWIRHYYTVEAESIEDATRMIVEGDADNYDSEYIAEDVVSSRDNGGNATQEIYDGDGNLVFDNVSF